ncbi:MAG: hypothetical protein H0T75_24620 [Rhizobiales bacterium]|nr:hypothetical protein [Hyphomicrobiales bacterium]
MSLALGVWPTILLPMLLVRRICGVLVLLALVLGTPIAGASTAGTADAMSAHGMNEPMPDGCPDCDGNGVPMAACAQSMCAGVPGILPAGDIPLLGTRLPFVAGPDESLAGISRLPDPKPPRTVVLG